MSEINEASSVGALTEPLTADQLVPAVANLLSGSVPAKTMAARGIAPLRPADLAVALFQLSFDADAGVAKAATAAPVNLPDTVLLPMLREPLPPSVLHFLGSRIPEHRAEAVEALLYNARTPDATFAKLAARLWGDLLEIVCQNETRLLRHPAIVKALFSNPAARMSSVNRAIELCARNNVEVDIPAYHEVVKAIREDPDATNSALDQNFQKLAETAVREDLRPDAVELSTGAEGGEQGAKVEGNLDDKTAKSAERGNKEEPEERKRSAVIDFSRLKIFEKIRLATFGNAYCRTHLIRDPNRLVAMAAIQSPKITDGEIVAAAAAKNVPEDVIRFLASSREYLKMYAVRLGLVNNPKCPMPTAVRLLPTLQASEIKKLSTSKNVPAAIAATARRIVMQHGGKG